ncbi:MAG: PH domain-containing protein, partial [Clostridia bacterium]|nr:PH domain-containing protein [Clostridia bacterium]
IYLFTVITSFVRLRHTGDIITDKSIYISGGVFAVNTQVKPLAKLSTVTINRGLIEKAAKVGTVVLNDDTTSNVNRANAFSVNSQDLMYLEDHEKVFRLIRDTQAKFIHD